MVIKVVNTVLPNKSLMFDGSIQLKFDSYTHVTQIDLTPEQADFLIAQLEVFLRECKDTETGEDHERNIPESNPATG